MVHGDPFLVERNSKGAQMMPAKVDNSLNWIDHCWRMRSEVSGGPGMQSWMSRFLPNIHLDGSPAVSFVFSLLSQSM